MSYKSKKTRTKKTKKFNKRISAKTLKKTKKNNKKQNGGKCNYIFVQGVNLDGLTIPDQYAKVDSNCQDNLNIDAKMHPNL